MSNEILERAIRTAKNTLDKARKTGIDPYLAMLSIRTTPISDKIPSPANNNNSLKSNIQISNKFSGLYHKRYIIIVIQNNLIYIMRCDNDHSF